jgi:hypothetical protein
MTNCNFSIDSNYPNIAILRNNDADIEINTYPPSAYPPLTTLTFLYEFFNGTEALPVPSTNPITGTLNIKYQYGTGGRETIEAVDLSTDNKTVILDAGNIAFLSVTNLTGCNFIRVTLQTFANTISNPSTSATGGVSSVSSPSFIIANPTTAPIITMPSGVATYTTPISSGQESTLITVTWSVPFLNTAYLLTYNAYDSEDNYIDIRLKSGSKTTTTVQFILLNRGTKPTGTITINAIGIKV